jgi:hypothetical protein
MKTTQGRRIRRSMFELVWKRAVHRAGDQLAVIRPLTNRSVVAQPLADLVVAEPGDCEIGASEHAAKANFVRWLSIPPDHEQQPVVVQGRELDRRVGAKRAGQEPLAAAEPSGHVEDLDSVVLPI